MADSATGQVSILLGKGDGTFAAPVSYAVGTSPSWAVIGDFNGDGNTDLAVANNSAGNAVSVLLGHGDGTFAKAVSYSAGSAPISVAAADFNGDGKLDLAVANNGSNNISVLLGNGDGTFAPAVNYTAGTGPTSIIAADVNGDGKLDLAVTNGGSNNLNVLLGNGDGTFAAGWTYSTGTNPVSLALANFRGDGKADLAIANQGDNTVSLLLGADVPSAITASAGTPQTATVLTAFATPLQVTVTDPKGLPYANATVTFTVPASGASATLSSATAMTNDSGVASITAMANGVAGTYNVSASVTGVTTPAVFVLTNAPTPVSITTTSLPGGTVGTIYSATLVAQGGTMPYTWSLLSGSLPAGLSLNASTGVISGTPSGPAATSAFTVQVVDSSSPAQAVSKQLSIVIAPVSTSPPTITTATLPSGVINAAYSASLSAQGGVSPYMWSISSGTLPAGLTLNAGTGVISGTPTSAGTSNFTVMLTDHAGQVARAQLSIVIDPLITLSLPTTSQQPGSTVTTAQVQSAQAVPAPVSGTITLGFNENATGLPTPYTNPGVCFSSTTCATPPQTTTPFTIPAGSTSVTIPAVQTGTVAGDIVLTLTVNNGQPDTTSTLTVPRTAPVIEANSVQILDLTSTGFVVELVANSTPRDLQTATFTFNAAPGAQISGTAAFSVNVSSLLSQWYSSTQGQTYGSAFSLQVPFTLSGNSSAIQSVTVTLTNSAGTSAGVTGTP